MEKFSSQWMTELARIEEKKKRMMIFPQNKFNRKDLTTD